MCHREFTDFFRTRLQQIQKDLPEHQFETLDDANLSPKETGEIIDFFRNIDGWTVELDYLKSLTRQKVITHAVSHIV